MPARSEPGGMGNQWYAQPATAAVELSRRPRLASWDAVGHPAQEALRDFLDHAELDLRHQLRAATPPWALEMELGLPSTVPLLDHHDLDNYLYPLAQRLGGHRLVSARAAKRHGPRSTARIDTARPVTPPDHYPVHHLRTTASAGTVAYKQQIHDQLVGSGATDRPPGTALSAVICFTHGPGRNWLNLWKPTLDAFGPLLGECTRPWNPRDGTIVELTLNSTIDPALGWDIEISATVVAAQQDGTGPS